MRIPATGAHNRWHPDLAPVATVEPGDEITLGREDGIDGQLTRDSSHADAARRRPRPRPSARRGRSTSTEPSPATCSRSSSSRYETADFGVTAVIPGFGFLADRFTDPYLVKWEIDDGVARSTELPGVAVPGDTFAGVVGVAPSHERMGELRAREGAIAAAAGRSPTPLPETAVPPPASRRPANDPAARDRRQPRHPPARRRQPSALPVDVPGALFSIGDLHFAQGDGEVCGTAIEVAGAVTLRLDVRTAERRRLPTYETPARPGRRSFATTGIPVDDAMDLTLRRGRR